MGATVSYCVEEQALTFVQRRSVVSVAGRNTYCDAEHVVTAAHTRSIEALGGAASNLPLPHVVQGVQESTLAAFENVPNPQARQVRSDVLVPPLAWVPAGQPVHAAQADALVVAEYRPTEQAAQVRSDDAEPLAFTNSPGSQLFQGRHVSSLAPIVNVPAVHPWQRRFDIAVPLALTKLPGAHDNQGRQVVAVPPTDHVPASQGLHVPADRNWPGEHVAAAPAASGRTKTDIATKSANVVGIARQRRMTVPAVLPGTPARSEVIFDDFFRPSTGGNSKLRIFTP